MIGRAVPRTERSAAKRWLAAIAVAAGVSLAGAAAQAQYPDRPIRVITPFAAGGGTDVEARIYANKLQVELGRPLVVENKPGGGTLIGTGEVVRARADGYTLLYGSPTLTLNPATRSSLPYDTQNDLVPISLATTQPFIVVISPTVKVNSLSELVALSKKEPGVINYGSTGISTVVHLIGEQLKLATGLDARHIPYTGTGATVSDLMSGRIHMYFGAIASLSAYVESGQLRALAVSGKARHPKFPNLPTLGELGVEGFDSAFSWGGFLAPRGTPPEVIEKLSGAIARAVADPAFRESVAGVGSQATATTPEAFRQFIADEIAKWKRLAVAIDLKPE